MIERLGTRTHEELTALLETGHLVLGAQRITKEDTPGVTPDYRSWSNWEAGTSHADASTLAVLLEMEHLSLEAWSWHPKVAFVHQSIHIQVSGSGGRHMREIQATVGQGTDMAYHPAPASTILYRYFPGARMISRISTGSSITCSPLPADDQTAEALITYLYELREGGKTTGQLITQFAESGRGHWLSHAEAPAQESNSLRQDHS